MVEIEGSTERARHHEGLPRRTATGDEAVAAAPRIGFPVALTIVSPDILHKTDVGGVCLNLQDVAFRVAPIGPDEAEAMIREIRSFPLLRGVRGETPSDMTAMVEALGRLSQPCRDFPEVVELDVNPPLVKHEEGGAVAIDARLALASRE